MWGDIPGNNSSATSSGRGAWMPLAQFHTVELYKAAGLFDEKYNVPSNPWCAQRERDRPRLQPVVPLGVPHGLVQGAASRTGSRTPAGTSRRRATASTPSASTVGRPCRPYAPLRGVPRRRASRAPALPSARVQPASSDHPSPPRAAVPRQGVPAGHVPAGTVLRRPESRAAGRCRRPRRCG